MVSEIVRVSKSNLHYTIAYRMRTKFNCWIIAFQGHQTCMYGSPDPSDFFSEGLARETRAYFHSHLKWQIKRTRDFRRFLFCKYPENCCTLSCKVTAMKNQPWSTIQALQYSPSPHLCAYTSNGKLSDSRIPPSPFTSRCRVGEFSLIMQFRLLLFS